MRIIKNGNLMIVSDNKGVIDAKSCVTAGLYLEDTRFISTLYLETNREMTRLQSRFGHDFITNRYVFRSSPLISHYDAFLQETMKVAGNKLDIEIEISNYSNGILDIELRYFLKCEYEDIFIVREKIGHYLTSGEGSHYQDITEDKGLRYEDAVARYQIHKELPKGLYSIAPKEKLVLKGFIHLQKHLKTTNYFKDILQDRTPEFPGMVKIDDPLLRKAADDLKMLMITTKHGDFPSAGLPWFATVFGRDSLIFSLQTLDFFPQIAKTVLKVLSLFQASSRDKFRDAVPGKILHEMRLNYLSLSNLIPFDRYYGTVDATLLYLILAGEYLKKTDDLETIKTLLPNIEAAEQWIYNSGDVDGDGYVEYMPFSEKGLQTQGWKDSGDSVSFSSGELANPPVAFVEVQGYLYMAYHALGYIYERCQKSEKKDKLLRKAQQLKEKFNKDYWLDEDKFFAIALDGSKRKVDSISSNPGQCLVTGIIDDEKIGFVVEKLMSEELFSGWGVRTLSTKMKRYNPFSYHNGSVWPHDNSLIIMGLRKYGYIAEARKISVALLEAMAKFSDNKLPELFSGLSRSETYGDIVEYPTSCSPQLWAIGSLFTISQALRPIRGEDFL